MLEPPSRIDDVQFDLEEFIYEEAIPKLQDPLPYKKTNSVFFDNGNNNNNGANANAGNGDGSSSQQSKGNEEWRSSTKADPRLRTVVCRHWMKGLCMKGDRCEFLHQFDLEKMPLCRHGERCKTPDCPFRHIKESERLECVFYKQGFCIHGGFCRYKHVKR